MYLATLGNVMCYVKKERAIAVDMCELEGKFTIVLYSAVLLFIKTKCFCDDGKSLDGRNDDSDQVVINILIIAVIIT